MELNRRDFLKGSLAFGGVAALGGLAGCATPQQASNDSAKDAKTGEEKRARQLHRRQMDRLGYGHDDDLFVQVTVAGGDIAGISVLRCDDTIGIGSTAAPMMATRILEAKNIDVDTVTGATTTSMAVQSAVADAITNAGGNPKDFRLAPQPPAAAPRRPPTWTWRSWAPAPQASLQRRDCWKPGKRWCSSRSRTLPAAPCP